MGFIVVRATGTPFARGRAIGRGLGQGIHDALGFVDRYLESARHRDVFARPRGGDDGDTVCGDGRERPHEPRARPVRRGGDVPGGARQLGALRTRGVPGRDGGADDGGRRRDPRGPRGPAAEHLRPSGSRRRRRGIDDPVRHGRRTRPPLARRSRPATPARASSRRSTSTTFADLRSHGVSSSGA